MVREGSAMKATPLEAFGHPAEVENWKQRRNQECQR